MNSPNRRQFLGQASCSGVTAIPLLNTLLNLRLSTGIASAVTAPADDEYRALVCIFQAGGNDSFNMLAPYDGPSSTAADSHLEYQTTRSNLALSKAQLHQITPTNTPGRTFGIHPAMPNLAALFQSGDASFIANVGTLIEPVSDRSEVIAKSKLLPLGLYSHSDQIEQWQTSVPNNRTGLGWAGKMMDLIRDINATQDISMNISAAGSNIWQTGRSGAEYAVSPGNAQNPMGGAVALDNYDPEVVSSNVTNANSAAIDSQIALQYRNLLEATYQQKRKGTREAYEIYSQATAGDLPPDSEGNPIVFPNTSVGRQLNQIARAIGGRSTMGALRQTFFVQSGGWDHHADVLPLQNAMLTQIDEALDTFYRQLQALGIHNNVTTFSASDFGRTLTSNGRGSDHAWGGNHFIIGGSVQGQQIFGSYPSLALNSTGTNPLDTSRGRLIPTTSCDEYFAELALWLGVPEGNLPLVLPNIRNFYSGGGIPVGFMA